MTTLNEAALAAGEAAWNASQVHQTGSVPPSPLTPYNVLSVTAPGDTNARIGGRGGSQSAWVVVQAVGKDLGEVMFAVGKADAAFLGKRLTATGVRCSPTTRSDPSPVVRDPDAGGLVSCTLVYRFTTSPA